MFPRIDRLSTLYFFHPLGKMMSLRDEMRIPVLMYHSISNDNENGVHPYYRINTSPDVFAEHMKFLHINNYLVITLAEAVKLLFNPQPVTRNPQSATRYAVLTFDDGFRDFYTQAYPILQKYGFGATVFLPTGFIEDKGQKIKDKEHLGWREVRELHKDGITFGSHTVTHPKLKLLKREDIVYEIRQSMETIEDKLGESIESFSCPYAFPDEDKEFTKFLKETLQECGYRYGVSTRIGTTTKDDGIFFLKRIPANSCDDVSFFRAKLEGAYDWLNKLQHLSKTLKGSSRSW